MELINKIKEYFGNYLNSPSKLTKRIKESDNKLKCEINEYLKKHKEYEKPSYLIISVCKDLPLKQCLTCGKTLTYSKGKEHDFCSNRCAQINAETRNKIEQTNIQKYGVKSPTLNKMILHKREQNNLQKYGVKHSRQIAGVNEKIKQTNIEKYGYTTPAKNTKVKEKIKQTNLERYGVACSLHNEDIAKKSKSTILTKYGVEHPLQNEQIKEKVKQTCIQKYNVTNPMKDITIVTKVKKSLKQVNYLKNLDRFKKYVVPCFSIDEFDGAKYYNKQYKWKCVKCGNEFYDTCYSHIPRCLNCYPLKTGNSFYQKEILNFIQSIYTGKIIENDRELIKPYELDIVIPEFKLAIEFNR